ncbi:lymphotoxin-alpha isoform X3 [Symphalangus syndactylus]
MTPPERLFLPRVRGTTLHLLLLGLLLVLLPGAQGLPGVGLTPSAAQTARQHPKMHLAHSTLKPAAHLIGKHPPDLPDMSPPALLLPLPQEPKHPPLSPNSLHAKKNRGSPLLCLPLPSPRNSVVQCPLPRGLRPLIQTPDLPPPSPMALPRRPQQAELTALESEHGPCLPPGWFLLEQQFSPGPHQWHLLRLLPGGLLWESLLSQGHLLPTLPGP